MTLEQQRAAKALKKELKAAKKAAKPVETPAKEQPVGGGLATVPKKAEKQKETAKPNSAPASENKESPQFTVERVTHTDLRKAWEKQIDANVYESMKLQLLVEKDSSTKKMLKEKVKNRKGDQMEDIGEPLHSIRTIQDNNGIAQSMIHMDLPTIGITNKGRIVAAFSYREESDDKPLYIEFLATAPTNMFSGTNPVKGAGRAAVKAMVAESLRLGKGGAIKLESMAEAVDFYHKMGFEGERDNMTLSPEAAKKYL